MRECIGDSLYRRRIFQWGHPGCFLELFGEILEGTIRQVMSNLCEVHCSDPNDFFCVFNLHLTEIFDRTAVFFFVEQCLQGRTADRELGADQWNCQVVADMFFHISRNLLKLVLFCRNIGGRFHERWFRRMF